MSRRPAFSLIELILAIGLSIALVALLGMAINLHLVRLDSSQSTIEQAQLARAVLARIADDLRGATTAPTQDVAELMAAAEAAGLFDVDELDEEQEDPEAAQPNDEPMPGINGTFDALQIDRSRVQQSLTVPADGTAPVARVDAGWSQVTYTMSMNPVLPGLVRSEAVRDHARWREAQGQAAPWVDPLASEVIGVRFAYFDGTQYVEQWDMVEQESLPAAVEVTVEIVAADPDDPTAPLERRTPRTYRRVVRLPAATHDGQAADAATADAAMGGL